MTYFRDIWNLVELIVLMVFFLSVSVRVGLILALYPGPMIFETEFIDYFALAGQYALSFNLEAICLLALFVKIFKYFQLSSETNLLWAVRGQTQASHKPRTSLTQQT